MYALKRWLTPVDPVYSWPRWSTYDITSRQTEKGAPFCFSFTTVIGRKSRSIVSRRLVRHGAASLHSLMICTLAMSHSSLGRVYRCLLRGTKPMTFSAAKRVLSAHCFSASKPVCRWLVRAPKYAFYETMPDFRP